MSKKYDLIVVGGGPAGYVGAVRGAQLGMKTLVIEKGRLGGVCLNAGCIPTKALYQSAEAAETVKHAALCGVKADYRGVDFSAVMERKDRVVSQLVKGVDYLMKKNRVSVQAGTARFTGPKALTLAETGEVFEAEYILVAAGSENAVPPVPGLDGKNVMGSTELLSIAELPESLAIVGGGVIGCEFAGIMSSFGVEVTVIEMLPRLLANLEEDCGRLTEAEFRAKGITVRTDTRVKSVRDCDGEKKTILCEKAGEEFEVTASAVLTATGRKPCTGGLGLEAAGIRTERGYIAVDDRMETSVKGIFAAGDVTGRSFLAHAAYEEAAVAVENMRGADRCMRFSAIPKAVFVDPEISSVGMSEQEAIAAGYDVLTGIFNMAANGKALAMGKSSGVVKVVSEKKNHEILGVHMAGPCASELVTVGTSLIAMEALLEDVAETVYPHPSVSEAIREACLSALGRAVHA